MDSWCWIKPVKLADINGPFTSREAAIQNANEVLTSENSDLSDFIVAKMVSVDAAKTVPDAEYLAGYILNAFDDNLDLNLQNPNDISFALVDSANVNLLKSFVMEWTRQNVVYSYFLANVDTMESISRTVVSKES